MQSRLHLTGTRSGELLDEYLHHMSELLSKIYNTLDMPRVLTEGLNHYTVVYVLNYWKLKDNIKGHQSTE